MFNFHLIKGALDISNELLHALQWKYQDIENAMKLVEVSKQGLQIMKDDEWKSSVEELPTFCAKNNSKIIDMDDLYHHQQQKQAQNVKNSNNYFMKPFYTIIDELQ